MAATYIKTMTKTHILLAPGKCKPGGNPGRLVRGFAGLMFVQWEGAYYRRAAARRRPVKR